MQIIPKSEAEQSPVGEAQDEPNENPKLEKPTEGRGIVNQLQSLTNIDLGNLKMP